MNEWVAAMVEWYWQMKTEVPVEKALHKSACCLIWPRIPFSLCVTVGQIIRSCNFGRISTGSRTGPELKISQRLSVPAPVINVCRVLLERYWVRETQCIRKVTFWQPQIPHICPMTSDVPHIHLAYHVEWYCMLECVKWRWTLDFVIKIIRLWI